MNRGCMEDDHERNRRLARYRVCSHIIEEMKDAIVIARKAVE
jgi:hypothetical protein